MVNQPEYPNGLPLFTYVEAGRLATVCLTYPDDGTPPLPLADLRQLFADELELAVQQGSINVRFLREYVEALDKLIASRPAPY